MKKKMKKKNLLKFLDWFLMLDSTHYYVVVVCFYAKMKKRPNCVSANYCAQFLLLVAFIGNPDLIMKAHPWINDEHKPSVRRAFLQAIFFPKGRKSTISFLAVIIFTVIFFLIFVLIGNLDGQFEIQQILSSLGQASSIVGEVKMETYYLGKNKSPGRFVIL